MELNKRGLSDVVTTVLIILLVLASISIIWSFVRPTLTKSAGQISGECFNLDLVVNSCDKVTDGAVVNYTRNVGTAEVTGVKVIIDHTGGTTVGDGAELNEFESGSQNISIGTGNVASEASVAGVIRTAAGEDRTCGQSVKVACA